MSAWFFITWPVAFAIGLLVGWWANELCTVALICSDNPPEEANSDEAVSNAELLENAKDLQ